MRIYGTPLAAINDIGRELKKCAIKVHTQTMQNKDISDDPAFQTREIQGFEFMITDMTEKNAMPGTTLLWAAAEFKERISSDFVNPGEAYKIRPGVWDQFLVDKEYQVQEDEELVWRTKKEFEYTYNERIVPQLQPVIDELKLHPESRQAIIELHNNNLDLNSMGRKRVPCSMFYHFMIRDGALDVIYIMRSTDFATHFQNDIWLADELRNHIASILNIPPGKFIMFASSLHIYQRDWALLKNY